MMSMQAAFQNYASISSTEATSSDINKWCKDAGVSGLNLTPEYIDFSFNRARVFGARYLTVDEMDVLIAEMAVKYKDDKEIELEEAISELKKRLCNVDMEATDDAEVDNLPNPKRVKTMSTLDLILENVPDNATLVEMLCQVERFGQIQFLHRDFDSRKVAFAMEKDAAESCFAYLSSYPLFLHGYAVAVSLQENENKGVSTAMAMPEVGAAEKSSSPTPVFDRVLEVANYRALKMTTNGLYNLFSLYGKVLHTFMHRKEEKSWISFEDKSHADHAKSVLNGIDLWGLPLKVTVSPLNPFDIPNADVTIKSCNDVRDTSDNESPSSCLAVSGIPRSMPDLNILGMLSQRGTVVRHQYFCHGLDKKTLFAQMISTSEAIDAIMAFHGRAASAHSDERLSIIFKDFDF